MGRKKDARAVCGKDGSRPADGYTAECMAGDIRLEDLVRMRNMNIQEADREALADIMEVKIGKDLSSTEKKLEFIRQIKNPYLYRQGEYVIKLSFADTDITLTDCLKGYIEHMAAAGLQ